MDDYELLLKALRTDSLDEILAAGYAVGGGHEDVDDEFLVNPDGLRSESWREGLPYDQLLDRPEYERTKRALQIELLKAENWVIESGRRVVIVFEGRDAAGKGGSIKRFTEHLNPRGARVVALTIPSSREAGQWYFQRYVTQLPTAGELVLFDRSWYNRAVVEPVMGFCTDRQHEIFIDQVPEFERMLVDDGTTLIKLWFSVTRGEQLARFTIRRIDPVRQWKLSPLDVASLDRWDAYTAAKEAMFAATHTAHAPWAIIQANDKKRSRLEAMRVVLSRLDYPDKDLDVVGVPDPAIVSAPDVS